jgi:hypothetical protein
MSWHMNIFRNLTCMGNRSIRVADVYDERQNEQQDNLQIVPNNLPLQADNTNDISINGIPISSRVMNFILLRKSNS